MRYEVQSLDPHRLARICAVVYGVVILALVVIALPVFLLAGLLSAAGPGFGLAEVGVILAFVLVLPVVGIAVAWVAGLLTGLIYNRVVDRVGCLRMDLREVDGPPRPAPPL